MLLRPRKNLIWAKMQTLGMNDKNECGNIYIVLFPGSVEADASP